ncbi:MAG: hypothetical protein IKK24_06335, partial [Clostridia bacterium]|nr:hypothetical protein [Clostridia bacterium]
SSEQEVTSDVSSVINSSSSDVKNDIPSSVPSSVTSTTSKPSSSSSASTPTKPKPAPAVETLGAVLRVKNTAYEYYNFNEKVAKAYAAYIGYAGEVLKDKAKVYDIVAPTSMGITLPEDVAKGINSSNQKDAINYIYKRVNRLSDNAVTVNAYDALYARRKEYIYFRTDHHWTALGAYYTYCEFIKNKGGNIPTLDMFIERKFGGYLGSFYSQTKSPHLAKTPDTVVAYEPPWTNTIRTTLDKNSILDKKIVSDGNLLSQSNKYLCFISGDRPYGIINNPAIKDGSSCLIIKESYGNAMVPFFLANYQTVHVIDYRHISSVDSRNLLKFVTDNKIQDVVFINNISATRNKALVNQIGNYVDYKN